MLLIVEEIISQNIAGSIFTDTQFDKYIIFKYIHLGKCFIRKLSLDRNALWI